MKTCIYSAQCLHCGHEIQQAIEDTEGQVAKPGVLLRCAECSSVSFAKSSSSTEVRDGPVWFVESEHVVEWFDYGETSVRPNKELNDDE